MSSLEILKLVQIGLRSARSMAEHADDDFLLYLIDMAILEVERQAHYGDVDRGGPTRLRQYLELKSAGQPRRIRGGLQPLVLKRRQLANETDDRLAEGGLPKSQKSTH